MPACKPLSEEQTTSEHCCGRDGKHSSSPSTSTVTSSSTNSTPIPKTNSSGPSPTPSVQPSILQRLTASWLQEHSEEPWTMWLRPFRITSDQTPVSTPTANLHAFYSDSTRDIRRRIHQRNNKRPSQRVSSRNCINVDHPNKKRQSETLPSEPSSLQ